MDPHTNLETVLLANWKNDFSGLKKHGNQGCKSIVYKVADAKANSYLLKSIPANYWSEQDEAAIISQAALGPSGIMPMISPAIGEGLYIRHEDQYLFLQEMASGEEVDFNDADNLKRTMNLLDRLHRFDAKDLPLKAETPLEYLTSKKFNQILSDKQYKGRFPSDTIAAIHRVFTSAEKTKSPVMQPETAILVHGDIKTDHVLLGEDVSQDRLIDCDTMHLGVPEEDYARLLTPENIEQFLAYGGKVDLQALANHQHLFLLSELDSAVNGMTTYADRMNLPESFIQEQSEHIQKIVPERLQDMALVARAIRLSGFQQSFGYSVADQGGSAYELPKQKR